MSPIYKLLTAPCISALSSLFKIPWFCSWVGHAVFMGFILYSMAMGLNYILSMEFFIDFVNLIPGVLWDILIPWKPFMMLPLSPRFSTQESSLPSASVSYASNHLVMQLFTHMYLAAHSGQWSSVPWSFISWFTNKPLVFKWIHLSVSLWSKLNHLKISEYPQSLLEITAKYIFYVPNHSLNFWFHVPPS